MLKTILRISTKVILGIFLFYLITGFIIIPLILTWAIPDQGTKFLKHPVHLHSSSFNPFSFKLNLEGFDILDHQNQLMIGFDKLTVKVSPIELLKKIYHVQSFEVNGLKINVELLKGNQINLLELLPPAMAVNGSNKASVTLAQPVPLPVVIIDKFVLHQGQIHFKDNTINPPFSNVLGPMELIVTNVTTNPDVQAKVKFHSALGEKGRISMETVIKPLSKPLELETTMNINDYALRVLSPYTGKYTGRVLNSGKLDLRMDYRIGHNKLVARHNLLIQRFEFGKSVESKDALHLPFGLAVALLEDPQGRINIALPVSGDMSDPKFKYSHLIIQVVRNFFIKLVTKPFSFLASSLGASDIGTDELGYVRFAPGKALLTVAQQQKLLTLISGFMVHPKLHLEIDGAYDPELDWKEIQMDAFTKEFNELRQESSRPDAKVYQLLYQRHFGLRSLWILAHKYKVGFGKYNDEKLDADIKQQLIENAPPDQKALSALAKSRAELIYKFLLVNGFDARRLSIGRPQSTQSSMGYVASELTLTVFGKI